MQGSRAPNLRAKPTKIPQSHAERKFMLDVCGPTFRTIYSPNKNKNRTAFIVFTNECLKLTASGQHFEGRRPGPSCRGTGLTIDLAAAIRQPVHSSLWVLSTNPHQLKIHFRVIAKFGSTMASIPDLVIGSLTRCGSVCSCKVLDMQWLCVLLYTSNCLKDGKLKESMQVFCFYALRLERRLRM
eukprot:532885-Amphidinium_carterae.1